MRFFISHSAGTDHAKAVLRSVVRRLESAGHSVFVDSTILLGDRWRSRLYHELALCGAAVVLLDQMSIGRRWVQREVDVLLWRRAFHPELCVLPVLLDATNVAAVRKAGFGEFTEQQFLLADGLGPAVIAERVAARVAEATPIGGMTTSRMEQWFDDLETLFARVDQRQRLRQAALELGVSPQDADQVLLPGGCRFLAHQFLGRSTDTATVDAISRLVYAATTDTLLKLAHLVSPAWVEQSASRHLTAPARSTVAVLNADDPHTPEHYVRRATCVDARVQVERVTAVLGEDVEQDLFDQCEEAVFRLLGVEPPVTGRFAVPERELREGPPWPSYLIVAAADLPHDAVASVIKQLRTVFPWLTVLLTVPSGLAAAAAVDAWGLRDVRVLEPVLSPDEEFVAHRTVRSLYRMIRRVSEGGGYRD
ncbi:toll/interleukin-1 receptor domain-containing protein [Actinoplanes auranticolor]|uniref:TIR domain-containing protein n=1 Tax=Actinoplanes auranticolor TaxID=47988 RepID=A0A919VSV1_9ACTN|nr:toll/interleukin-1 receptor domain-containing protein [Actinoplanes auranticolor]GIM77589.1 hypothetical protein Aau02nite_76590 [Actinoplanes auranticolor]